MGIHGRGPTARLRALAKNIESSPRFRIDAILSAVRRAVRSSLLLYLDFDGVLHPADVRLGPSGPELHECREGHALFEHACFLASVLVQRPDVQVVLSTSWVLKYGFKYTLSRLPEAIRTRVVGTTFDMTKDSLRFQSFPRYEQIAADVRRRRASNWIAIDAEGSYWPSHERRRLLLTNPMSGLGDPKIKHELLKALNNISAAKS